MSGCWVCNGRGCSTCDPHGSYPFSDDDFIPVKLKKNIDIPKGKVLIAFKHWTYGNGVFDAVFGPCTVSLEDNIGLSIGHPFEAEDWYSTKRKLFRSMEDNTVDAFIKKFKMPIPKQTDIAYMFDVKGDKLLNPKIIFKYKK